MLLKKETSVFRTAVFRITVWYVMIFFFALITIYVSSRIILSSSNIKMIDNILLQESNNLISDLNDGGLKKIKSEMQEDAQKEGLKKVFYRLLSKESTEIFTSNLNEWQHMDYKTMNDLIKRSLDGNIVYRTIYFKDKKLNTRVITREVDDGKYVLQIGRVIHENQEMIERYDNIFGWIVVIMMLCGTVLGWRVTKKTIAPVERITQTALKIGNEGFTHRVKKGNEGEEIDRLADAFNNMLDRIEILMFDLRDVTDNIAHDLKTPVTRIKTIAETSMLNISDSEGAYDGYEVILEECDHLTNIINTILDISEADAGLKEINVSKVDLVSLVKKGYELFSPVAEDKGVLLKFSCAFETIAVSIDDRRLQRIISNLLDNAIKFTGQKGNVIIEIDKSDEYAEIIVKDTGIGIKEEELEHIFEKFYRVESSRSTPGSGLGLTWVRSMITAMGGTISVKSEFGKGSTFILRIPLNLSA